MQSFFLLVIINVFFSSCLVAAELPKSFLFHKESQKEALSTGASPYPKEQSSNNEPTLPKGLNLLDKGELETSFEAEPWFDGLTGFIEARLGGRIYTDNTQKDLSIGESRGQIQYEYDFEKLLLTITADFVYDSVIEESTLSFESQNSWLSAREANVYFTPSSNIDMKVGRQILTWGTGDLLFINDLFPKDWKSLLIGRDEEYLKAPSDAIKTSFFSELVDLDIVYTPRFDSDRFIDGTRLSYYSPLTNNISGRQQPFLVDRRDEFFNDDELALRVHRLLGAYEAALYYYNGYWKSPGGLSPTTGEYTFPKLNVYGISIRGPLEKGIATFELGHYDSRDDKNGSDPFINNSEYRLLIGFERELAPELTGSFQYYIEILQDYRAYKNNTITGSFIRDKRRQVLTQRLTYLMLNQRLRLSAFNFWSPSDNDGYLRLKSQYQVSDYWQWGVGANILYGEKEETFFGQLENNSNLYFSVAYSF